MPGHRREGKSFGFPKDAWLSFLVEYNVREESWHCPKGQFWTCTNGDPALAWRPLKQRVCDSFGYELGELLTQKVS
jgi:hypothetical protein